MDLGGRLPRVTAGFEEEPGSLCTAGAAGHHRLTLGSSELEIEHLFEGRNDPVLHYEIGRAVGGDGSRPNLSQSCGVDQLDWNANAGLFTQDRTGNHQVNAKDPVGHVGADDALAPHLAHRYDGQG